MIRLPRRTRPEDRRKPRFTEGLIAGALIGAAIAGSTLWSRFRRSHEAPTSTSAPEDAESSR